MVTLTASEEPKLKKKREKQKKWNLIKGHGAKACGRPKVFLFVIRLKDKKLLTSAIKVLVCEEPPLSKIKAFLSLSRWRNKPNSFFF